jgi:hypothetical protein
MSSDLWRVVLSAALLANAALGLAYRVYRLRRGGPPADVVGQALLALVLGLVALLVGNGVGWSRWVALAYGLLFGVVVMPVWILAVFIPLRPGRLDIAYAALYWTLLGAIAAGALAM